MNAKLQPVEDLRFERKFAAESESISSFLCLIKSHSALFRESYAERRVNSIYFDTDDYSYYFDTVFGKSDRHKVRVRWYGNDIDTVHDGAIEIKSKTGLLGFKKAFALGSYATDNFLQNYRDYISSSEALDEEVKQLFRFLRPMIIVSYLRRYFVSADKNFRITLDYDLTFYDVQTGFNSLKKVSSPLCVLELKYPYENDELARTITSTIPNRYSRSSKYRIGLESLNSAG